VPDEATNYFRVPGWLRQQAGLGRIGVDARAPARTAYGLAIENVERGFLWDVHTGGTNYSSLAATSWTALDATNLSWMITTSGKRPVEFRLSAYLATAAVQSISLSLAWNGVEFSGRPDGVFTVYNQTANSIPVAGFAVIDQPGPGTHTLTVVYKVSGGAGGFVEVDADRSLFVSAKEI
jgi:hypothetical protein